MTIPYTATQFVGGSVTALALSAELNRIELAFTEYLQRTATEAGNSLEDNLDLNDHSILNVLVDPESPNSVATVGYVESVLVAVQETKDRLAALEGAQTNFAVALDVVSTQIGDASADADAAAASAAAAALAATNAQNAVGLLQESVQSLTAVVSDNQAIAVTQRNRIDNDILPAIDALGVSVTNLVSSQGIQDNLISSLGINVTNLVTSQDIQDTLISDIDTRVEALEDAPPSDGGTVDPLVLAQIDGNTSRIVDLENAGPSGATPGEVGVIQDNQANISQLAVHEKAFSFSGVLPDDTQVAKYIFTKAHILRATGAPTATGANRGHAEVPAGTGNADFQLFLGGINIGTILFGPTTNEGTFDVFGDITFGVGTQLIIRTGSQFELADAAFTLQLEEAL